MALGTVVDTNGLALTKASEIKPGKLTCWLASDKEVDAEVIGIDQEEDIALIRVHDSSLKPVTWSTGKVALGEWAITPGIAETPHAMGIVSVLPRRIHPPRALIGVDFDRTNTVPTIGDVVPGMGAEKAGIKSGDVVLAINSIAITNSDQVVEILRDFREGQEIQMSVQREKQRIEAKVQMMSPKSAPLGWLLDDDEQSRMTGELSHRSRDFEQAIEHDTVLPPWLCGGPLVDLDGKAIGLNIARAGRVSTYALPASLVQKILGRLKASQRSS